ncbi:MAG: putative transcriptional regulator [Halocynthiibacter sp.]|jgi:putative transcriptional regulator
MEMPQSEIDLTGMLLIAMPGMADTRFETSVVYICAHSPEGAMGLIVNKPVSEIAFDDLLEQLEIERGDGRHGLGVHFGGPVEHGRGFVLHSCDYQSEGSTLRIDPDFSMTATRDILADIAKGQGPAKRILTLGYAGWGPGQIEDEIGQNGWLSCAADPAVVFGGSDGGKWEAALRSMGVEPIMLSGDAGHA